MSTQKPSRPVYFSNGQALQRQAIRISIIQDVANPFAMNSPPLSVRLTRFFESVYVFLGLYFVSLFSVGLSFSH